jgi:shikimate dehydrogenase
MKKTIKAAVIGHPVAHSKSPLIHRYWIKKYGLNGDYDLVDVPSGKLSESIGSLKNTGYAGFNVTIPHKQSVMDLCDLLDESAKHTGAVNTVKFLEDGRIAGMNTDAFCFVENIREHFPEFSFEKGPALVLGAGGAARAIVYALLVQGAPKIIIVNRTIQKAEALAKESIEPSRVQVCSWEDRNESLKEASLLVNTTSAGMTGMSELDINLENLSGNALVNDIVYSPLITGLLNKARESGNPVVTGIGMLLHQARPAFKEWFGITPEVTEDLRKKVLQC